MNKSKLALSLAATMLILAGCADPEPPQRLVEVVIDEVRSRPYRPKSRYIGRLQAQDDVAIQARVTGYLVSRDFKEGELVQAGDVLYTLDDSEYVAALARSEAELAAAVAMQANAERNFRRGESLIPQGAISEAEMDELTARKLDADARIESAQAQLTSARVNLGFTTIKAPITGRIGRSAASVGDLVGPTTGNLTTLVSIDPIEALFQISEATYVAAIARFKEDFFEADSLSRIEVGLELANGLEYPEKGHIDYLANRIDQSTGTLEARALVSNPHATLVPGQYVRVVLRYTETLDGLFIPQSAVQADQQGSFVLVVDPGSTVIRRNVELGDRHDDKVLVRQGVDEGDRVIVRGLQQVRPGMPVQVRALPAAAEGA